MQQSTKHQELGTKHENEVLVRVNGVSKKFCRDLKKSLWYGVKDVASELLPFGRGHRSGASDAETEQPREEIFNHSKLNIQNSKFSPALRAGEFWAVKDVSFELRRGECLGLIGRNGAGKTTLLKMLNGLIKPDSGTIEMRGRVGALIALGAGFNPILTGRENIYVNGSILGLTKEEIDAKIEEIIDFAEIRDFIDAPVQSYSSGMQVRLGFAVATALNPDVLILDEVLAVGDASFRNKCYKRIAELRKNAAIIFVTHQMSHIARMCDSTLVLKAGKAVYLGDVEEGVHKYEQLNDNNDAESSAFLSMNPPIRSFSYQLGAQKINQGDALELRLSVESNEAIDDFILRLVMYSPSGDICVGSDTLNRNHAVNIQAGENHWKIVVPALSLKRGIYPIAINLMTYEADILVWSFKQLQVRIDAQRHGPAVDYQPILETWVKTN